MTVIGFVKSTLAGRGGIIRVLARAVVPGCRARFAPANPSRFVGLAGIFVSLKAEENDSAVLDHMARAVG